MIQFTNCHSEWYIFTKFCGKAWEGNSLPTSRGETWQWWGNHYTSSALGPLSESSMKRWWHNGWHIFCQLTCPENHRKSKLSHEKLILWRGKSVNAFTIEWCSLCMVHMHKGFFLFLLSSLFLIPSLPTIIISSFLFRLLAKKDFTDEQFDNFQALADNFFIKWIDLLGLEE